MLANADGRIGKKGVDAIFTPQHKQRDARFLLGLAGVVSGAALCTAVAVNTRYPKLLGAGEISSYSSLVLSSLGIIFAITGTGISLTYSSLNASRENDDRSRSDSVQARGALSSNNMKFGLIAFIQTCIAITLYSGLAEEYQSNSSMRAWIHSILPLGQVFLSGEFVLVFAALLGIAVVQFLPGQVLAE